ncbi:MAG: hypothetical protein ACR2QE_05045 [Acidimicrobiales bacterium]
MAEQAQPLTYLWTDIRRLLRYWWVVLLAGALAAGAAWLLTSDEPDEVRVRQSMTLVDVDWQNIQAAHERNQAWVENELPPLISDTPTVEVVIEPASEPQSTAFLLVGSGTDETSIKESVDRAVTGLVDAQEGFSAESQRARDDITARLTLVTAEMEQIETDIEAIRTTRLQIEETQGYTVQLDALGGELSLAEQRRRQLDNEINSLEGQLRQLDRDVTSAPTVAAVGQVRVESDTPSVSQKSATLLAGFAGILIASIAALAWDRRWGRLVDEQQLARLLPDYPVANVNRGSGAGASLAEVAAAARRLAEAGAESVAVIGTTPEADGQRVIHLLDAELHHYGLADRIDVVDATGDLRDQSLWMSAHARRAIVVTARRSRGSNLLSTMKRLEHLRVEVLLVALSGRRSREGRPVTHQPAPPPPPNEAPVFVESGPVPR